MAKETMLAVSQAENDARRTVLQAEEEAEKIRREAAAKGRELLADAVKEARKRADVLRGVARADGEKRKAAILQEAREEQQSLEEQARARQGQAAREVERIVLGNPRQRR